MSHRIIRWGILGTAQIAKKNWQAIYHTEGSTVAAVASRDIDRCRRFVAECQAARPMPTVPDCYGSYEELLAAAHIDAVYIPLPTAIRKLWVIRAAEAGKHVLCEKPCAASVEDLEEMLAACRRHNVQFMEGVMFAHSTRLPAMRKVLDDGTSIGAIRRITSAFTFSAPAPFFSTNIRADSALEPLGCLGDLGWYCIRFSLWAMNWQTPLRVSGQSLAHQGRTESERVPIDFSGELLFNDGVSAGFYCSFTSSLQQWAKVSGDRGHLELSDFVLPEHGDTTEFFVCTNDTKPVDLSSEIRVDRPRFTINELSENDPTAQESAMIRAFAAQIRSGILNEAWPEQSLKTQRVLNRCYESAKLTSADA